VRKRGVRRRDSRVASEREVEAAAHAVTANRRDYRPLRIFNLPHDALAKARKLKRLCRGQVRNLGDFCAGGKGAIGSGDDCPDELVVAREMGDFLAKLPKNRALEAWESVVAVEPKKENIFLP